MRKLCYKAGMFGWFIRQLVRLCVIGSLTLLAIILLYAMPSVKPVSTLMLGGWLRQAEVQREWVSIEELPAPLIHTIIAAEDARFCSHYGVDWHALELAVEKTVDFLGRA